MSDVLFFLLLLLLFFHFCDCPTSCAFLSSLAVQACFARQLREGRLMLQKADIHDDLAGASDAASAAAMRQNRRHGATGLSPCLSIYQGSHLGYTFLTCQVTASKDFELQASGDRKPFRRGGGNRLTDLPSRPPCFMGICLARRGEAGDSSGSTWGFSWS